MDGFRKFILRGNVIDLAIGVVIGAAFTTVVTALVKGVFTPIIGLAGSQNFDNMTLCLKNCDNPKSPGVLLLYGSVITALIQFLIVAAVLYFFVVKPVNALMERRKTEPEVATETKSCDECLSNIPVAATRCAFCTVEQPARL